MTGTMNGPRRDPRRLFSRTDRNRIADRQHQMCGGSCGEELPKQFHVHHIVPWAEGGRTDETNGIALCPECHRNAEVRDLDIFEPREWQREALPRVLGELRDLRFATVSAAPGAGKTLFAGWVYRNLRDTGDIARVVIFVPNAHLRTQWADVLRAMNVFLHTKGTSESRSYDGVVLTYHALSDPRQVSQIIEDAEADPTLFILDEVHHLAKGQGGEASSWAVNIARIVGNYENPQHRVLNLSGTLFRSNRKERISTIRYQSLGKGQIETIADYMVSSGRLVAEGQLRHIKLLGFDAEMRVEAVDIGRAAHDGARNVHAVDIDDDSPVRSQILSGMVRNQQFISGILAETVTRLGHASAALNGAPVKGLLIADGVDHAEQVHAALADTIGARHAFIAHGQMSSAEAEIQRFRMSTGQAVMVAVQKVTEGFDVPDICVLTYMRTWKAPLFINQMAGRAMRVTPRERELRLILPATILVPNDEAIKSAFADILVGAMDLLQAPPEPCEWCGREVCACLPRPKAENKTCPFCQMPWRFCQCECRVCGLSRQAGCKCPRSRRDGQPPLAVDVTGDGRIMHVSIDGHTVNLHLVELARQQALAAGLPQVHVEQLAHSWQQAMRQDPMSFLTFLRDTEGGEPDGN